jgi:hypothetical protein
VIVAALVLTGVAVLVNGFSDGTSQAAPSPSTSATPTESPSPTAKPDDDVVGQKNAFVQVFNGTNSPGAAADFLVKLMNDGYFQAGEPEDAPEKPVLDSIVYYRTDNTEEQNQADAALLARDYLPETTSVEKLPPEFVDIVDPTADVIVVLGEDVAA